MCVEMCQAVMGEVQALGNTLLKSKAPLNPLETTEPSLEYVNKCCQGKILALGDFC